MKFRIDQTLIIIVVRRDGNGLQDGQKDCQSILRDRVGFRTQQVQNALYPERLDDRENVFRPKKARFDPRQGLEQERQTSLLLVQSTANYTAVIIIRWTFYHDRIGLHSVQYEHGDSTGTCTDRATHGDRALVRFFASIGKCATARCPFPRIATQTGNECDDDDAVQAGVALTGFYHNGHIEVGGSGK